MKRLIAENERVTRQFLSQLLIHFENNMATVFYFPSFVPSFQTLPDTRTKLDAFQFNNDDSDASESNSFYEDFK